MSWREKMAGRPVASQDRRLRFRTAASDCWPLTGAPLNYPRPLTFRSRMAMIFCSQLAAGAVSRWTGFTTRSSALARARERGLVRIPGLVGMSMPPMTQDKDYAEIGRL